MTNSKRAATFHAGGGLQILPDLIQGTPEWHEQRRGIVTASTVGKLITVTQPGPASYFCRECASNPGEPCMSLVRKDPSPIRTFHARRTAAAATGDLPPVIEPADDLDSKALTLTLVAERITDWTDPTYVTDDMYRGVMDEPRALEVYSELFAPVTTVGFMVRDDWGFKIGYSPDGLVGDDGLVECKSRRQKKHLQTILADEVPPENMAQLQCGLLVSGREWMDYVSYCGGMPLWVKRVEPDPAWRVAILCAVERFEHHAAHMAADYHKAVKGLPVTERITNDLGLVF